MYLSSSLLLCVCIHNVRAGACVPWCISGGQRTALWSQFCLPLCERWGLSPVFPDKNLLPLCDIPGLLVINFLWCSDLFSIFTLFYWGTDTSRKLVPAQLLCPLLAGLCVLNF